MLARERPERQGTERQVLRPNVAKWGESMKHRLGRIPLAVLCILVFPLGSRASASDLQSALEAAELLRAERRASSVPVTIVSPYYSVAGEDASFLYLMNTIADPVEAEIVARELGGERRFLGRYTVEPTQHTVVPLQDVLAGAGSDFLQGSIEINFLGDFHTLQGWIVLSRGKQLQDWHLSGIGEKLTMETLSFWDTRPYLRAGRALPVYHLTNGGSSTMTITAALGNGQGDSRPATVVRTLPAGHSWTLSPLQVERNLSHGWVRITHDGQPGTLFITGLLEGAEFLGALPLVSPSQLGRLVKQHSMRFPLSRPGGEGMAAPTSNLGIFNPNQASQEVSITVLDQLSGNELARTKRVVGPQAIKSLDVGALLHPGRVDVSEVRVVVEAAEGVVLAAHSLASGGEVVDVSFSPYVKDHENGSYPLPSLSAFDVFTTFVNLSDVPARVLVQLYWEGGTYAFEPIRIPAGASHRIRFAEMAEKQKPDIMGRTIDPDFRHGFLQWTAQTGSRALLARTEAVPKGSRDAFGFNCFGCCSEISVGSLFPASIAFDLSENPLFQATEIIHTCNGTMGPFPADILSLSYFSPISWNGVSISASNYTYQNLSFTARGERVLGTTCASQPTTISGIGPGTVDKCQAQNNPGHDPARSCAEQSSSCTNCYDCCEKQKQVGLCRCAKIGNQPSCKGGIVAACGTCKQVCVGTHIETCTQQTTSCSL